MNVQPTHLLHNYHTHPSELKSLLLSPSFPIPPSQSVTNSRSTTHPEITSCLSSFLSSPASPPSCHSFSPHPSRPALSLSLITSSSFPAPHSSLHATHPFFIPLITLLASCLRNFLSPFLQQSSLPPLSLHRLFLPYHCFLYLVPVSLTCFSSPLHTSRSCLTVSRYPHHFFPIYCVIPS